MSWFTEFLADTARQAAPGIHQAINTDIQRKQRLGELEQQIPLLVKQQQALMPGEVEKANVIGRIAMDRDAANRAAGLQQAVLLEHLKQRYKASQETDPIGKILGRQMDVQNPNYGAGEEAAGGVGGVAPRETIGGLEYLRRSSSVPSGHVPKITQGPKGTTVNWEAQKPESTSARSRGVTNPLIQAGMFLGYGADIENWTPEQHSNAEAHELEKKIAGAINLDRKLYEDSLKMFPGDKLSGLNEFIRVLMTRAAGQSYGSSLGPTLNAPPVPYPNAQTAPLSGPTTSTSVTTPSPSSGLYPEEQSRVDKMSPAEKKAFLSARGTAGGSKPTEETKRQVAAGLNVARMLDDLSNSTDIDKYGYAGQRAFEEGRDIAAGYTLGKIKASPEYIKFRQILRQLELGAFDFGGKQLTQTEKDFVMAALPSSWQRNPESMRAAIKEFSNRVKYMTGLWSKFASLSGAEYDNLVATEMAKYKGSSTGAPPRPSTQGPSSGGWSIKPKGR